MKKTKSIKRSLMIFLSVLIALIVYAYGFQVTKVNLEETKSERRQTQLVRILRALAKPDIIGYDKIEVVVEQPILIPCPPEGYTPPAVSEDGPYLRITPACTDPSETVIIEGFNMAPGQEGPVNFIPPSGVKLSLGNVVTDGKGYFKLEAKLPNRPSDQPQKISMTTRQNVGSPHFTQTAFDTWEKIVETVFLALLATTVGMVLAIPLSFFAARNLMKDITMPFLTLAMNILAIPLGAYLGAVVTLTFARVTELISDIFVANLAGIIAGGLFLWYTIRQALPQEEISKPTFLVRTGRTALLILDVFVTVLCLFLLSNLADILGNTTASVIGTFGFIGTFIADLGEILRMSLVLLVALAGAGVLSSSASKLSKIILRKLEFPIQKAITIVMATLAIALLFVILMAVIDWLYQINTPLITRWIPTFLGGGIGLVGGIVYQPRKLLPVGIVIYYISRTIFNALRSIEALIMVIVFVVWVGIGPFAGVLALGLHTIAALAKLYSEQVESILAGPLEAITATGANRLQTIIYAVIPQIIPPYISFTMYRWDINVRMSTIIGFAGGGGIGFLLIQNINLLNYRAASTQMIAIALVVASMDYISSRLREKLV